MFHTRTTCPCSVEQWNTAPLLPGGITLKQRLFKQAVRLFARPPGSPSCWSCSHRTRTSHRRACLLLEIEHHNKDVISHALREALVR